MQSQKERMQSQFVKICHEVHFKDMLPTSFQSTMLPCQWNCINCFHIIIPPCYFAVHLNTLKQLESHILVPSYATNSASRPMATKRLPHCRNQSESATISSIQQHLHNCIQKPSIGTLQTYRLVIHHPFNLNRSTCYLIIQAKASAQAYTISNTSQNQVLNM